MAWPIINWNTLGRQELSSAVSAIYRAHNERIDYIGNTVGVTIALLNYVNFTKPDGTTTLYPSVADINNQFLGETSLGATSNNSINRNLQNFFTLSMMGPNTTDNIFYGSTLAPQGRVTFTSTLGGTKIIQSTLMASVGFNLGDPGDYQWWLSNVPRIKSITKRAPQNNLFMDAYFLGRLKNWYDALIYVVWEKLGSSDINYDLTGSLTDQA